ncbi:MAG: hypothetical protein COA39_007360 [Sulfurimonas sp.]|nr:hypothetical protein [Sulfurimonas sp.]
MIKLSLQFFIVIIFLLFTACGNNSNNDTNSTGTNDETLTRAAIKINDLTVKVHDTTFETTSGLYTKTDQLLSDFTRINQSVTDRMNAEMQLLTILAKPFEIKSNYTNSFSENNNFNATVPPFTINTPLTNNYFLVSSTSKFYLQGRTIKTFFIDSASLTVAWSKAIENANKNKDLYLSLLEIDTNGKVTQVTNSFLLNSETLKTY